MKRFLLLLIFLEPYAPSVAEIAWTAPMKDTRGSTLFVDREKFGQTNEGVNVDLFTLKNENGLTVKITNYGGIVTSMSVPDKMGNFEDIVLGFDNLQNYLDGHPYFGALIGRYANRIASGMFELKGRADRVGKIEEKRVSLPITGKITFMGGIGDLIRWFGILNNSWEKMK